MYCADLKKRITWACCHDEFCPYHETRPIYNRGASLIATRAPAAAAAAVYDPHLGAVVVMSHIIGVAEGDILED